MFDVSHGGYGDVLRQVVQRSIVYVVATRKFRSEGRYEM